ncbi:helix-turn-helix transcriptional regulator [Piscinibacter sakaiensis]|uniref:helix-turn-helix transcriptional regulator n=1 Tax=Piscinibacter sakaiensis TaxID=1547922 RepID=UPI003AABC774
MLDFSRSDLAETRQREQQAGALAPLACVAGHGATGWPHAAFDEIDYGMLLLGPQAQVLASNVAARIELDEQHPLQLSGGQLRARRPADAADLQAAIDAAARRGLRRLLSMRLDGAAAMVSVSVVPMHGSRHDAAHGAGSQVLVLLGKRRLGGVLAIEAFARSQGLSCSETRVLCALVSGSTPAELAERHGVAISTIRTQIGSIRAKTGAASIRELIAQIATLPPLMEVLRPHVCTARGSPSGFEPTG